MNVEILETLILVAHVLAALAIIGLVLLQQGKGADMGSGFGAGASSTVFGSGGAGSFLTKMTTAIAIAFFVTSFALAYYAKQRSMEVQTLGIPQVIQQIPQEFPVLDATPESEVPAIESSDTDG
jgi:preprotein translocase subunit SecG